jgi:peptidoglycan/LPS O-acetylase OafA/YrhL
MTIQDFSTESLTDTAAGAIHGGSPTAEDTPAKDTAVEGKSSVAANLRGSARLLSIQYTRAVAAVSVVFFHAFNDAGVTHYPEQVLQSGVDLFFAISGFIMWVTTYRSNTGPREFLRKRIIRIVPLYWVFTGFAVLLAVVAPQLGKRTGSLDAVASFLFLPAVNTATHQTQPVVAPGWTLNHEMLFYLIFAIALVLPGKRRFIALIAANVGLVILGAFTHGPLVVSFYTNPIVLEFVFGVIVGLLYTSGYRMSRAASGITVTVGALTMIGLAAAWGQTAILRVVVWGIPAALIVLALALTENTRPVADRRRLRFLGDASYSVYIVHGVLLSAMLSAVKHENLPKIIMIPLGGPLAVIAGLIVYRYLERPMTRYLRDVGSRRVLMPSPTVALMSSEPMGTADG